MNKSTHVKSSRGGSSSGAGSGSGSRSGASTSYGRLVSVSVFLLILVSLGPEVEVFLYGLARGVSDRVSD